MKIYVLIDNREYSTYKTEHGLSVYIEYNDCKILLDTGATDTFLENAKLLGCNLNNINTFVLSHGHYDHGSKIDLISEGKNMIMHPDCFTTRISKRTGNSGGINQNKEKLQQKYNLILSTDIYKITDDIIFLGEIPRNNNFECKKFPMMLEDGKDDEVHDDTGIVINTSNGLVIFSSCSHSGICNIVDYAKKITNTDKIYAIIGGFHLKEVDDITLKTIQYMEDNKVENIYLAHCISDEVCKEFQNRLSNKCNVSVVHVGKIINL